MKKFILLVLSLTWGCLPLAATAVRGTLLDLSGQPLLSGYLKFELQNCPDSAGTAFIIGSPGKPVTYIKIVKAGPGGAMIDNIIGNDQIICGGGTNTFYHVTAYNGTVPGPAGDYHVTGGTWNYNNAAPVAQAPVNLQIDYMVLNPSGSQVLVSPPGQSLTINGTAVFGGPVSISGITDASISGNAATATALVAVPVQCGNGLVAQGIQANGDANCTAGGGGGGGTGDSAATPNTLVQRDVNADFAAHNITANQLIVSAVTGPGFVMANATLIPNLNADFLGGHHFGDFPLLTAIPDCQDGIVSKLLFNATTKLFSCGNDQVGGGGGGGGNVVSINGSTVAAQSFPALGTTGTAPAWVINTGAGTHTLNIPLASAATVTAGLLSNADYVVFNAKQATAQKGVASGYAGLDAGAKVPTAQLPSNLAYFDSGTTFTGVDIFNGGVTLTRLTDAVPLTIIQPNVGSNTADIFAIKLKDNSIATRWDPSGNMRMGGTGGCVTVGTNTWCSGTGAPTGACVTGSYYTRTDGIANNTVYICQASVWSPFGSTSSLVFNDSTAAAATALKSFGQFTPERAITITRFQVVFESAPSGCTTQLPTLGVVQAGNTLTSLLTTNGVSSYDSGPLAINASSTSPISVQVIAPVAVGCTAGTTAGLHYAIVYRMQ